MPTCAGSPAARRCRKPIVTRSSLLGSPAGLASRAARGTAVAAAASAVAAAACTACRSDVARYGCDSSVRSRACSARNCMSQASWSGSAAISPRRDSSVTSRRPRSLDAPCGVYRSSMVTWGTARAACSSMLAAWARNSAVAALYRWVESSEVELFSRRSGWPAPSPTGLVPRPRSAAASRVSAPPAAGADASSSGRRPLDGGDEACGSAARPAAWSVPTMAMRAWN